MGTYVKKSLNSLFWLMDKVDKKHYLKLYPRYLKWLGIQIDSENVAGTWISPTTFFDSSKYNYLEIGKAVTISFDVSILVHDFSIVHAARSIGKKTNSIIYKRVKIGNNVFIGAKSIILPGSIIGDSCVVGGGTVVRGHLEANSIYAGDPCKKIGNVDNFTQKYKELIAE